MKTNKKIALGVTASMLMLSVCSAYAAEGNWAQEHPRRAQVNQRLDNQNNRINKEVAEGDMSQKKANRLKKEDHQVRQEERNMASQNGGHITQQEQQTLNQQENGISKQIGR